MSQPTTSPGGYLTLIGIDIGLMGLCMDYYVVHQTHSYGIAGVLCLKILHAGVYCHERNQRWTTT